jgi:hypothetical protein
MSNTPKLIFPMRNNVLQTRETSKHELSRFELAHPKIRLHASRIFERERQFYILFCSTSS